ncbi:related to feruloyl esterase B precursor [Ramularia collo-cygni]|uniref:Carboxylic ester hydrolase n=1 Tax=Ramularia collo-cygni TaxID=112498 RepID=A0A2D3VCR0_9PEZI|nr:related to feruloyl esterase B precursor [Ramularia collo-cygni]CZT20544.1 related to feruloyl esterase B precursor [Ramularia collo-cygni]
MLCRISRAYSLLVAWALLINISTGSTVRHQSFRSRCLSFAPETHIQHSRRTILEYVTAGTNLTLDDNDSSCKRPSQVVATDICRVALSVATTHRSSITFELWLPDQWSGRFLATGNGGVDGCIKYEDLAYGSSNGFVTAGANNGHNGTTLVTALENEDVLVDFSYRSLHTTAEVGKELAKQFYGQCHSTSYYLGCSLGGRQAIGAADRFPDDFDGIFAGAPAVDFNNLYSWRASFPLVTNKSDSDPVMAETWKALVHDSVLSQCDGLDGVMDGIIEDPTLCNFDPSLLLCSDSQDTGCLSPAQVNTVKGVYSPYTYPNGTLIYPALQPGMEIAASAGLLSGQPFAYSVDWFKYVIYQNASWDPYTYSTKDAAVASLKNPADIQTWPQDLAAFRNRGGKLIMTHGQQDHQISSYQSPRLYERLREGSGSSYREMDNWLRFFRISGMNHCSAGPGAWVMGQGGGASATGIGFDPESNILAALVQWVEGDEAPETILGTKFENDTVSMGRKFQRRHCRWPFRNEYVGGDASDPASWNCRQP